MSEPASLTTDKGDGKRRHRSPNGPGWFVTDQEIYALMGVPEEEARQALRTLDKNPNSGFPKKQPLFGDRRYLPAVKLYFDKLNNVRPHSEAVTFRDRTTNTRRLRNAEVA